MKEEQIVRTSIYLPKGLFLLAKKKQINMSKMFRMFLEEMLKDDEVEILKREIEELERKLEEKRAKLALIMEERKKKQEMEEAMMKVAEKLANYLTMRLKQWMEAFKTEDKRRIVSGAVKIMKLDYGIDADVEQVQGIFEKAMSNGSVVKPNDVKHLLEGKQWVRRQS